MVYSETFCGNFGAGVLMLTMALCPSSHMAYTLHVAEILISRCTKLQKTKTTTAAKLEWVHFLKKKM